MLQEDGSKDEEYVSGVWTHDGGDAQVSAGVEHSEEAQEQVRHRVQQAVNNGTVEVFAHLTN